MRYQRFKNILKMIDWTTILIAIVGSISIGELVSLFTAREQKKGMQIDNKQKEDERWEHLVDQLQDQVEKLQNQIASLNERVDAKDTRIIELEDNNASLRSKLDEVGTDRAICKILRCDTISCPNRVPPLGFKEMSIEEAIRKVDIPEE